jgi:hypothetical protein
MAAAPGIQNPKQGSPTIRSGGSGLKPLLEAVDFQANPAGKDAIAMLVRALL